MSPSLRQPVSCLLSRAMGQVSLYFMGRKSRLRGDQLSWLWLSAVRLTQNSRGAVSVCLLPCPCPSPLPDGWVLWSPQVPCTSPSLV